jgi:hypothetical protein
LTTLLIYSLEVASSSIYIILIRHVIKVFFVYAFALCIFCEHVLATYVYDSPLA